LFHSHWACEPADISNAATTDTIAVAISTVAPSPTTCDGQPAATTDTIAIAATTDTIAAT